MLKKGDWVTVISGHGAMVRVSIGVIAAIGPHVLRLHVAVDRDWQPAPREYAETFYIDTIRILPGAQWDAMARFKADYRVARRQDEEHWEARRQALSEIISTFEMRWRAEHPEPELPDPMAYFKEA